MRTTSVFLVIVFLAIVSLVIGVSACGGITRDQVQHSQREYDLAVGIYANENNTPGAFEHLLNALEIDPENPEAHLLLGKLLMIHRSDFEQAEHHMREAIRTNSIHEIRTGLPADARTALGVLFIHMERFDDAIAILSVASNDMLNREPHMAYANLTTAHRELGQLDEAVAAALRAVQGSPNFCVGLHRLGRVRIARDEDELALEALDRLLDLERCQVIQNGWRIRAEVRARRGDRQGAIEDFERCIELDANSEDGQACQLYLDEAPLPDPVPSTPTL